MNLRSTLAWILGMSCLVGQTMGALAQQYPVWANIDCAQTKIAAPAGLKCRATQETSGGIGNISGAGAGGMFRRWSAFGTLHGAKLYYHLSEATSLRAEIRETASLEDGVKKLSRQGKEAKDFSTMTHRAGVDLLTFASAAGEPCVGIRRYGPSAQTGYKWILNATRCTPKGSPASEAEIDKFIAEAGYRS
ncbi:MAG TPA: hypothetical protein VK777_19910 [Reyranella sp.]|jgi:hypothetical protein|nr:hypothetical protein [Reyranella sp.]